MFIFVITCIVSGCGAARLGYSNGETISYWWLDRYVDFDADQQPMVKKHLSTVFAWHRKTQLKDYVQVLASAQKRLQHNVAPSDLKTDLESIKKRLLVLTDRAAPELADLALSLRPHQIVHFEKKLASNNDKYRKDYLRGDTDERQRFRFKRVMEQAEYWFGDFSVEQEAQIRSVSDARPLNNELWFADKLRRQRELISILKKIQADKPTHDAVTTTLKQYMAAGIERPVDHEQKAFFDSSTESTMNLTTTIINITTPTQKERAIKKAQQWIDDFNILAAKAG